MPLFRTIVGHLICFGVLASVLLWMEPVRLAKKTSAFIPSMAFIHNWIIVYFTFLYICVLFCFSLYIAFVFFSLAAILESPDCYRYKTIGLSGDKLTIQGYCDILSANLDPWKFQVSICQCTLVPRVHAWFRPVTCLPKSGRKQCDRGLDFEFREPRSKLTKMFDKWWNYKLSSQFNRHPSHWQNR